MCGIWKGHKTSTIKEILKYLGCVDAKFFYDIMNPVTIGENEWNDFVQQRTSKEFEVSIVYILKQDVNHIAKNLISFYNISEDK